MMTRKYLWLALCSAFLLIAACQKAPELTLTGSSKIELSVDGSSATITFTANRDWRVSSSDSWVSVSPSSGTASDGPVSVTVRCNANTTYDDRTATVTIMMEELSQAITVRQPANLGIVLPSQSFDLQSDARSIEVEVKSNVEYSVETSVDWIKQTGTKGLTSKTLTFSIEENKTYDPREGKITIKSKVSSVPDQVISVKQAQKDAIIVEKTSYDMPYGGGEIEIKVEANVGFDVTPDSEWLHHVSTKALSSSTVLIKVDENETYNARNGKVEITQQNGSIKHTIAINQAGRIAVTSVELRNKELTLMVGHAETLVATVKPDDATDKTVTWTSSNIGVATVDEAGRVTAIKDGTAAITARVGEKSATCAVTVKALVYVGNAVDLGIIMTRGDGTRYNLKWADCNLGSDKPEESGDYYAWGETESKDDYSWETYKFWISGDDKSNYKFSKYNTDLSYGSVDEKTVLDLEDDVAHVKLGGKWRMPTKAEQDSLRSQCTWTWTTKNGMTGYEVKSKVNSNSIFLPIVGIQRGTYHIYAGAAYSGNYWSSTLGPYGSDGACDILITSGGVLWGGFERRNGASVRPVIEEEIPVASIELNKIELALLVGDMETLVATVTPDNATDKSITWTSSDASIASVDAGGKVTAIKDGIATITVQVGGKNAECIVVVGTATDGAINLGIVMTRDDGTKYILLWAESNLGASAPEDSGDYYAWGETETKNDYGWATYKWAVGNGATVSKYCPEDKPENWAGEGAPDNKMVLDFEDDAARVRLGGKWRMPTRAEQRALLDQCVWTSSELNGKKGYEVKSKSNSNYIFLPATGSYSNTWLNGPDIYGYYWSSSVSSNNVGDAICIFFHDEDPGQLGLYGYLRSVGCPIRPVTE